ncbi:hypothetical protein [Nitrincola iocasae]|uniref:Uncharacterized protein n=1 Tax=Nitrincola iocasae TaxID=2614693 RepID=A0A5J6LDM8_9GAMM|nr:hypothetical protein [Nitrincola iocasae]QEW06351.1 hypothetical protein F5I99_07445 [Nitrincola iocasae]
MYYSKTTNGFYSRTIHGDKIPEDAVEITKEIHMFLIEGQSQGKIIKADENFYPILVDPPPPTPTKIQAGFESDIQQRLDDFARTRNYSGIMSACTYATSTVPKFATEGQHCVNLRDATWAAAYQLLDEVLAGTRPMPSSIADIESDLPVLEWPE